MTNPTPPRMIHPRKTYVRELTSGIRLEGEVSPCVFMCPGYPLQVTVALKGKGDVALGTAFAVERALTAQTATDTDVARLLDGIRTVPCRRCSAPAFDPATIETNRAGLCESCFLADLGAEVAEEAAAQALRLAERDRGMKRAGMNFRVRAWIHPDAGDDYPLDWYFAAHPSGAQIRELLREQGSTILEAFQVLAL